MEVDTEVESHKKLDQRKREPWIWMKGLWRARRKDGSRKLSRCRMICCWSMRRCRKHQRNYPVRDVKIIFHHEVHGLEIQISSTSADNTNVWVVISKSSHRYVDELRYKDPENSHEEADYECMQHTDQDPPIFNWKCQTITFRLMNGNGKTSVPMNSVTNTRENLRSRNLSVNWYDMKIVETERQMVQFIGH